MADAKRYSGPLEACVGRVVAVNLSKTKGTVKKPLESVDVDLNGLVGDAHSGRWHRQISLLAREEVDAFEGLAGRAVENGEFAENITTAGLDLRKASVLDRIVCGDVELEVTQIGKKCHGSNCAIYSQIGECIMPREGIFSRVVRPGAIRTGQSIELHPRAFRVHVVTLSDRASAGEYEDLSGPAILVRLDSFFSTRRWHYAPEYSLLPDNPDGLESLLGRLRQEGVDVIFTTGGTGLGPRDFTPEVVTRLADKMIPGVMDHIRLKYGATNPNALVSRSVAAVLGGTLVFALPGSVKAVHEYVDEILKVLEHMVAMLHGLGH